jgi:hypothetical protein
VGLALSLSARHSATNSVNICPSMRAQDQASKSEYDTSIVSSGPPALSGWNCTPHTRRFESDVDLMPSTDESLQLMKKGSHPSGNGSCSSRAY